MGQITSGLRAVLSSAGVYNLFQHAVGAERARREFVHKYVRPQAGDRVLDIGCGTGEILEHLPATEYFGFDASQEYIDSASARFGSRGRFACETVTSKTLQTLAAFDIVLAVGILHHLDDHEAIALLTLAKNALVPGGRLITLDVCYVEGQSPIARFIISRDRGQNVRNNAGYEGLARAVFVRVEGVVRHDLARVPLTHLIMECTA